MEAKLGTKLEDKIRYVFKTKSIEFNGIRLYMMDWTDLFLMADTAVYSVKGDELVQLTSGANITQMIRGCIDTLFELDLD